MCGQAEQHVCIAPAHVGERVPDQPAALKREAPVPATQILERPREHALPGRPATLVVVSELGQGRERRARRMGFDREAPPIGRASCAVRVEQSLQVVADAPSKRGASFRIARRLLPARQALEDVGGVKAVGPSQIPSLAVGPSSVAPLAIEREGDRPLRLAQLAGFAERATRPARSMFALWIGTVEPRK